MGLPDLRKGSCKPERHHTTLHAGSRSGSRLNFCSWFDIRVFYVRVVRCLVPDAPDSLTMCFPARSIEVVLEINGGRVSPSEQSRVALRRDRVDPELEEVTYVSTDNLRICGGGMAFEIYDKHEFLVRGVLKQQQQQQQETASSSSSFQQGASVFPRGWRMECSCCEVFSKCSRLRSSSSFVGTCMEVYVMGRYGGTPVILTETVQLVSSCSGHHRKSPTRLLDAIPEDEECSSSSKSLSQGDEQGGKDNVSGVSGSIRYTQDEKGLVPAFEKLYVEEDSEAVDSEEDGEIMSWFNAGVRVGVGIGLGMCLGVGIGVGLLVRTYNATAKSLRKGGIL